ncbi:hypothetical protein [Fulvivirga lutea]|uniref:Lipoprotein n=1 Tax=Fulvivirga lutea TaxID=2810512 RepID=A0A975A1P3_9BACT|nr:hypothetical protein [Fulvivirga lutea]QSE98541.1 hypothetical protein JR347_05530 [Fulvivirga lutea]
MKRLPFIIIMMSFLAFSCSDDDNPSVSKESKTSNYSGDLRFEDALEDIQEGNGTSDEFTIYKVSVVSDSLLVEVGYAGGCQSHEFELIWPDAIITIYPYDFGVILNHNANGDLCEAFIQETLFFNLSDNPLGLNDQSIQDMKITIINGSDPDNAVSNKE